MHTDKLKRPANLATMEIRLRGAWGLRRSVLENTGGAAIHVFESLRIAEEQAWDVIRAGIPPLGIAVPSVLDAHWNVVLCPRRLFFWSVVQLEKITPFRFDIRMFPEKTAKKVARKTSSNSAG